VVHKALEEIIFFWFHTIKREKKHVSSYKNCFLDKKKNLEMLSMLKKPGLVFSFLSSSKSSWREEQQVGGWPTHPSCFILTDFLLWSTSCMHALNPHAFYFVNCVYMLCLAVLKRIAVEMILSKSWCTYYNASTKQNFNSIKIQGL